MTDKRSHTPGPWTATCDSEASEKHSGSYWSISAGAGFFQFPKSDGGGFGLTGFISREDATLMAAAPDLLEALQALRDQQVRMIEAGGADGPMDNDMIVSFAKVNQVLWDNAEAAIAKATGE